MDRKIKDMAKVFGLENREVVRIRVKKCDGLVQPEYKKLCVDPQLTSFEILQNLLARAFVIKGDFTISYAARDAWGRETYLSLLSDWDLDAAFLSASDPCLRLKVDLKPFEEGLEDWDIIAPVDIPRPKVPSLVDKNSLLGSITGTISSQVGKTVSQVSKAIGLKSEEEDIFKPFKPRMSDAEFHRFLDGVGVLIRPQEFRLSVYQGGIEASLRKVVWRHLLNIFPDGLTGKERFDYMKKKCNAYYRLRDQWREQFSQGKGTEEIKFVTNMVKKDVLRTDRNHKFYAGSDDNQNILSLFNILVTYALTHPDVSYCQGMSDLASPILVVQNDEAHAYICFCGAMKRLKANFLLDGEAMTSKFQHLALLLQHHDPDFFYYLKQRHADDMFFCYRWLLLELKREFPFDDALYMLEVLWSSLPPDPPEGELELVDPNYTERQVPCSPTSPAFPSNAYLRLKTLCRQSSSPKLSGTSQSKKTPNSKTGTDDTVSKDEATKKENPSPKHLERVKPIMEAVTPNEEEKYINTEDYLKVQDSATQELMEKCSTIDRSLELLNSPLENGVMDRDGEEQEETHAEKVQSLLTESDGSEAEDVQFRQEINGPKTKPQPQSPEKCIAQSSIPENRRLDNVSRNKNTEAPACGDKAVAVVCDEITNGSVQNGTVESPVSQQKVMPVTPSGGDQAQPPPQSPKRPSDIPIKQPVNIEVNGEQMKSPKAVIMEQAGLTERSMELSSCEEASEYPSIEFIKMHDKLPKLPPPHEFGYGNPFLIFLCLTLLIQQRDHIIRNRMDYNDLAMHFDKMVRRHDVNRVLHQAQSLYAVYLRSQQNAEESENGSDDVSV